MSPIELRLMEKELRKSNLNGRSKQLAAEKVEELKKEMERTAVNSAKLLEVLQHIVEIVQSEGPDTRGARQDLVHREHRHKSSLSFVRRLYRKEQFISRMR